MFRQGQWREMLFLPVKVKMRKKTKKSLWLTNQHVQRWVKILKSLGFLILCIHYLLLLSQILWGFIFHSFFHPPHIETRGTRGHGCYCDLWAGHRTRQRRSGHLWEESENTRGTRSIFTNLPFYKCLNCAHSFPAKKYVSHSPH